MIITNDETQDTIENRIDNYMIQENTKKSLEKIFDKVLQKKTSGLTTAITQLSSKYLSAVSLDERVDILTGLVILNLAASTFNKSLSSRALKISQSSK
jgi:hypothetical protein